ncbi:chemotaxis protein CheW [Oscillospiraceae bacterium MB08-C2-2]|nr:chemotaxis protein CheW [Oscillospiraceae bacterium MB08-C2-2]
MQSQDKFSADQQEDHVTGRYLTFFIDKQLFGIPVGDVVQIVGIQKTTQLPEHPDYIKGIINLRGQIIPVIDIRLRLGKPEAIYTDRTCIIITHIEESDFGLIVDEVDEVIDIAPSLVSPPPRIKSEKESSFLEGVARLNSGNSSMERVALLIHPATILCADEVQALAQISQI